MRSSLVNLSRHPFYSYLDMRFFISFAFTFFTVFAYGQINSLVYEYSFNNCNGLESFGGQPGVIFGIGDCECGVDGFALNFNSPAQFAQFPRDVGNVLGDDFTFSFYMKPQNNNVGTNAIDIWTIGNECNSDTIFQVRYFPNNGEMRVRFADQALNSAEVSGILTGDHCWSYIVITKEANNFSLYIDNDLAGRTNIFEQNSFTPTSELSLSLGPCDGQPFISPYQGLIDELRVYSTALSQEDIIRENYFPNQIIEEDVVIFKGESVFLETGGICTDDFSWSPETGLDAIDVVEPLASPEETTIYTLTVNDGSCQSVDQINVVVVDLEELDCSDLLLPSAFTPNGDGKNDVFGISNSFIVDELLTFEVFDKWGGRMFYATENVPTWDGRFRNDFVMPGPYVFRVRYLCQGEEIQKNGVVNVIR